MSFSSSPISYPPSSSPAPLVHKRKVFEVPFSDHGPKKSKLWEGTSFKGQEQRSRPTQQRPTQSHEHPRPEYEVTDPGAEDSSKSDLILPELHESLTNQPPSPSLLTQPRSFLRRLPAKSMTLTTTCGKAMQISSRSKSAPVTYERTVAERSVTGVGRAKKAYYGVEIHSLMDEAITQQALAEAQLQVQKQRALESQIDCFHPIESTASSSSATHQLWTEKYRAKKFTELVGDERTHRSVLRWMKAWDPIVFPGNAQPKPKKIFEDKTSEREPQHHKILLLTGPPGLGKTTLAHVCAKQAGYEVLEINASDDRSRDIVKGRIKDALGTENVRGVQGTGKVKRGRPVCVVVDEVDGAVAGSGASGGEGGFVKALIDLIQLDQRNSSRMYTHDSTETKKKKAGDKFRLMRPLILICNDIYAPSLRPIRTSSVAEIVHVRRPPIEKVSNRLKAVFEKEKVPCDVDAIRRICENSWGLGTWKQNGRDGKGIGEGDIRSVLVQGQWIAHKFRDGHPATTANARLTRKWIETQISQSTYASGGKGFSRGAAQEIIERIFQDGAGLPNLPTKISPEEAQLLSGSNTSPVGVADIRKRAAIGALREMVDTCGEHDRLMTDCFATYPTRVFQDDVLLSKPNAGYDWLYFHDCLSSRVYSGQEWELNPYLSTGACGFHHLFASVDRGINWREAKQEDEHVEVHPFSGLKADFAAYEAEKQKRTVLTELQASFSGNMLRLFTSTDKMATELIPSASRMFAPEIKPVVVGGNGASASVASVRKESEKNCVRNAVRVMDALNVAFEKVKVDLEGVSGHTSGGFIYRMEPPLDTFSSLQMGKSATMTPAPVRFAVRQVLDQELKKEKILKNAMARQARSSIPVNQNPLAPGEDKENEEIKALGKQFEKTNSTTKRDFFGRIVNEARPTSSGRGSQSDKPGMPVAEEGRVWVSFHEGFSNAVRKPITLRELMESF